MKLLIEIERRRGLLEGSVLFPDGKGYSLKSPFFEPSLAEPPPRVVSEMARLIEIVMRPAAAQEHKELDDLLPDNLVNRSQAVQAAMEIQNLHTRFDEADRLVNEHAESWRQIQEALPEPDPADPPAPLAKRVVARLKLVDELQNELKVQAIHAKCAREVLQDIRRILPPCDEEAHVNYLTGLESRLAALPARVEKLAREHEEVKRNNHGLWERAGAAEKRENELLHTKQGLEQQLGYLAKFTNSHGATWAYVVSETISTIEKLNRENEKLARERKNWEERAAICTRNTEFYRDLLDKVAAHLGPDVFVSNDGSVQDEPLRVKIPGLVERLARENETLARNVPPTQGTAIDGIRTVGVIGQQWCRCDHESDVPEDALGLRFDTGWIVLCNVVRNVETGGLTYEPLARKDLPDFRA